MRRFCGQFNNIMSVLGKSSHEMNAVYLLKTYCLPTLTYGLENAVLTENTKHKINVIWNNSFCHTFRCCCRESVRPLQYFCKSLPLSHLIDQSKLLFSKKMYTSNNVILYSYHVMFVIGLWRLLVVMAYSVHCSLYA